MGTLIFFEVFEKDLRAFFLVDQRKKKMRAECFAVEAKAYACGHAREAKYRRRLLRERYVRETLLVPVFRF